MSTEQDEAAAAARKDAEPTVVEPETLAPEPEPEPTKPASKKKR